MNIPNSLLVRIWGPFLAMACGLLFLTGVYVPLQQKRALEKFQREELQVIAETVAQAVDNAFANNELQSATRAFSLLRDRESIEFGAYYFKGDTTVVSFPEGISFGRIMAQAEANLYVTAKFDTPFGAGVVVIRGLDAFVGRELFRLNAPLFMGLGLVFLALMVLYLFLRFRVSGPLQTLRNTAERIRTGDLDTPVDGTSRIYEVRALNLALERLRKDLSVQRETNQVLTRGMEDEIARQTKDLRKTLNELQDSRNLFGSVIQSALDATVLADGQSRIVEWNRRAEQIFGWTRDEVIGKPLGEINIPHVQRNAPAEGMEKYPATGHGPVLDKVFETQALRKNGELVDIEIFITHVEIESEVIFSSFIRDITESKRMAADIEKQRSLYESLLDGLPLMVSLKNEALQFTFVNDEASRVLGVDKKALLGKEEKDVFDEPWVEDSVALDRAGYEGENVPVREREFVVDGQFERYLIGRYQYNVDVGNRKERYLLTYGFNISELKAIQMELEQALKAKDEFMATVSHEIRTPLHSIIVLAELLNQGQREDEHGDFATNIRTSSRHLLELVNDLLDFSKAEAGKLQLDPEVVEMHDFVDDITRLDSGQRREAVEFVKRTNGCEGKRVQVDRIRLQQVVSNLLSNAFKFTENGVVELEVQAETVGNRLQMHWSVKDSGIGISLEDQQRILDAFQQAHTGIARRFGGTGLGLGIVVRILELMDSELHIDSKVGEGATFSFTLDLPLAQDARIESGPSTSGTVNMSALRLLYVEDMLPNQMVMRAMCKPWGLNLTIAPSGKDALSLFDAHDYDLVLMDIQMPEIDGIETLRRMRSTGRDVPPTHAFTAHSGEEDRQKFLDLGFAGVITKPITPDQLESFLKRHLHEQNAG